MPTLADALKFYGVVEADVLASAVRADAVVIVLRDGRKLTYQPVDVSAVAPESQSESGEPAALPEARVENDKAQQETGSAPEPAPKPHHARSRKKA